MTNLLNPKSALFSLALLPGFLPLDAGLADISLLVLVYLAVASGVHLAICLAAAKAQRLVDTPTVSARLRGVQTVALVLVAV